MRTSFGGNGIESQVLWLAGATSVVTVYTVCTPAKICG